MDEKQINQQTTEQSINNYIKKRLNALYDYPEPKLEYHKGELQVIIALQLSRIAESLEYLCKTELPEPLKEG